MSPDEQPHYAALALDPVQNRILMALHFDVNTLTTPNPGRHWRVKLANFSAPADSRQVLATVEGTDTQLSVLSSVDADGWLSIRLVDREGKEATTQEGLVVARVERVLWA